MILTASFGTSNWARTEDVLALHVLGSEVGRAHAPPPPKILEGRSAGGRGGSARELPAL